MDNIFTPPCEPNTYTGIGSRETPIDVLDAMYKIAVEMARIGWTLRSGGAPGADQAFEFGSADEDWDARQIFLPWPNFEAEARADIHNPDVEFAFPTPEAFVVAAAYHPRWQFLSQGVRKLMARNTHQVLGLDLLSATQFIVCYTPDGEGGGGTGQALRIAAQYSVPVVDLGGLDLDEALNQIEQHV